MCRIVVFIVVVKDVGATYGFKKLHHSQKPIGVAYCFKTIRNHQATKQKDNVECRKCRTWGIWKCKTYR
jgi:hypothetical protein